MKTEERQWIQGESPKKATALSAVLLALRAAVCRFNRFRNRITTDKTSARMDPKEAKAIMDAMLPRRPQDWTEDYADEDNGCYTHRCNDCGIDFCGHKGRRHSLTCKLCQTLRNSLVSVATAKVDEMKARFKDIGLTPPSDDWYNGYINGFVNGNVAGARVRTKVESPEAVSAEDFEPQADGAAGTPKP